jgi:3-hydroxyacyl-[acyl-carrier-protein] dehydratase
MLTSLEIPADHPCFAGHFPTFPVLPGALLLDEMLQVIQRELELDLEQWKIASAKFLDVVRPGDVLNIDYQTPKPRLIRFTVLVGDRTVASGTLSCA